AFIGRAQGRQPLAYGDAKACAFADETQALDFALQTLGNLLGQGGLAAWKHRSELLPTDAPEQITAAQRVGRGMGHLLQDAVPGLVPMGVIDEFEVIDVQQQEGQRRTQLPGLSEFLLGAFEEMPAVAALGQYVDGCQTM